MKITLKNFAAGRKALFKRIFVYCGSALAAYEIISLIINENSIAGALSRFPVYSQYIFPLLNNLLFYLGAAIILALLMQKGFSTYSRKINGTDISISINVGDIFKNDGDIVVPCNNLFAHDQVIIGNKSIHYQLMQKCASNKYKATVTIEEQIANALETEDFKNAVLPVPEQVLNGKSFKKYPYGMLLPIKVLKKRKQKYFYLLSMSEILSEGKPHVSDKVLLSSIDSMWKSIKKNGVYNSTLVIPVMGTGAAKMVNKRKHNIAKYIIKSFADNASQLGINNMILSVYPGDYLNNDIDLDDLRCYIDYVCRYPDSDFNISE